MWPNPWQGRLWGEERQDGLWDILSFKSAEVFFIRRLSTRIIKGGKQFKKNGVKCQRRIK